jgi:hypothetical protein
VDRDAARGGLAAADDLELVAVMHGSYAVFVSIQPL